jgi:hypothetical protein
MIPSASNSQNVSQCLFLPSSLYLLIFQSGIINNNIINVILKIVSSILDQSRPKFFSFIQPTLPAYKVSEIQMTATVIRKNRHLTLPLHGFLRHILVETESPLGQIIYSSIDWSFDCCVSWTTFLSIYES